MSQFVGRPVIVEAHAYEGTVAFLPDSFRQAVVRYFPDGTVGVMCGSDLRVAKYGDWIVHGPDGLFTVLSPAAFETSFAPAEAVSVPSPAPARREQRKTHHG